MKALRMFSSKHSLATRLFVVAMIVSIAFPQAFATSLVYAEEAVNAEPEQTEVREERAPEENSPAITVDATKRDLVKTDSSNEVAAVDTTIVTTVDDVVTVDNTDVVVIPTDTTDTTVDNSANTDTNTGTDTTPTNGGDTSAPAEESADLALRKPQTGSITICNVIAKADGTIVTSPAGLPNAAFSLNLRSRIGNTTPIQTSAPVQETTFYSHLFTQTNPSPIPVSAQCLKYNNLELKQYIYSPVTVTSQLHGRWETPKYNDGFNSAVNTIADFYPYSYEMFDNDQTNDGQRNESADGILTLEAQRPHRVLVILNQLKPYTPPTSGTIMVCKVILDDQGEQVFMGSPDLPQATFSVEVHSASNPTTVTRTASWDSRHYMAAWPSGGADPSSPASALDADCKTFDNLPFDPQGYVYNEETITGTGASYYVVPRYNDGATKAPSRSSHFYHYGPGIYGDDQIPGLSNNPNSDGKVVLSEESPVAKIFVLNQHNTYTPPTPVCANGTTISPAEFIINRDLGFITYDLGPLGPTADAEHIIIHASSTVAKFHITNNTGCTIPIGFASYKVFDIHQPQEVHDIIVQEFATSSTDLVISVPTCVAQVDVFYGKADHVLQPYGPNGENPYIYPGAQGNFIFTAGFYFPTHGTWGDLPNGYCPRNPVNTPPTITLIGANPMEVILGSTFTDPGATAFDAEDVPHELTPVVTGSVDTNTLGSYTITYTATDSAGLTASVTRTVNVVENPDGGDGDDNDDDNNGGGSRRNGQRRSGGQILGAETGPTSCFYLRDYLRRDLNNDSSEVLKLQLFLKYFDGATNLEATGTFDQATYEAVNSFQNKYKGDILTPWGHTAPTGYVYILTKKKVNEIFCQTAFPVNSREQEEIDNFRAFLTGLKDHGISVPSDGNVMIDGNKNNINDMIGSGASTSTIAANIGKIVKDKIDTKNLRAVAAAIFSVPQDREAILESIYFLLIAIIAIYLFTEIIVGSRDSSRLTKHQIWARKATGYFAGLILAIVAAVWYQVFAIVVPLLVLAIATGVFLAWAMTRKAEGEAINLPPSNR